MLCVYADVQHQSQQPSCPVLVRSKLLLTPDDPAVDGAPPQLRGIVRLSLPRSARVRDISLKLIGTSRTDWPEGLKHSGIEMVEQVPVLQLETSVFRTNSGLPISLGGTEVAHAEPTDIPAPTAQMWPGEVRELERYRERTPSLGRVPSAGRTPPLLPRPTSTGRTSPGAKAIRGLLDGFRLPPRVTGGSALPSPPAEADGGDAPPAQVPGAAEWFELRRGDYEYPFSLSLPRDLPPTLHADFGCIAYTLKATLYRAGPLATNVSVQREVTLVQTPNPAGASIDLIHVSRVCENMLSYTVALEGRSFPIGTVIPLQLTLSPMGKLRVLRMTIALEEQIEYFANERRTKRQEMPRKWTLLRIPARDSDAALLPVESDALDALAQSPLAPYVRAAARKAALEERDAVLHAPINAQGPWRLALDLAVTMERQKQINISCVHPKSNTAIRHQLKIKVRVESSVAGEVTASAEAAADGTVHEIESAHDVRESRGAPRVVDVVIGVPITLTHSHTSLEWISLPSYEHAQQEPPAHDSLPMHDQPLALPPDLSYIRPPSP